MKMKSNSSHSETAKLFRILAKLLEKTDAETLANFLLNELDAKKLNTLKKKTENVQTTFSSVLEVSAPNLNLIADSLKKSSSRDEGYTLIQQNKLNRKSLEGLGRILGTPILKTDNMERLTAKIVEASIGARLSSEAIRGKLEP